LFLLREQSFNTTSDKEVENSIYNPNSSKNIKAVSKTVVQSYPITKNGPSNLSKSLEESEHACAKVIIKLFVSSKFNVDLASDLWKDVREDERIAKSKEKHS
jgi:hypothetical protein